MMLIILEGCDGSGKTTVAKQLAEVLDAEIIHCTRETPNDFEYFSDIILKAQDKNIIADRFCYGQFVYQEPEERKLTKEQLLLLEDMMIDTGAKLIYMYAPHRVIKYRLGMRAEITSKPVEVLCQNYMEVLSWCKMKPLTWWSGEVH